MRSPLRGAAIGLRCWSAVLSLGLGALMIAACGDDGGSDDGSSSTDGDDAESAATDDRTGDNPTGCVDEVDQHGEGDDLFPDKFEPDHADNLSIEYHDTYKVVTVGEPYPDAPEQTYVLIQCGTEAPDLDGDLAGATVVEVPVRSLFSQSTSHLGFIDELGVTDLVTGVSNGDDVTVPSVAERVASGEAVSFSVNYEVDIEVVLVEDPDVFVTAGTEDEAHAVLGAAGVPVLANAEWLETSPLGWAEWIGFFAALTNTEARANETITGIEQRYEDTVELAADVADRPTVLTGSLVEGDWYARGGAGVVPRFIADAGGDYVYAEDSATGSLILDVEQVLTDARDAEVWLPGPGFDHRDDAGAEDERYLELAAWDEGGVWRDVDVDESQGISRTEHGPVMADVMLMDYLAILHPDLVEDHELVFFEPVPES